MYKTNKDYFDSPKENHLIRTSFIQVSDPNKSVVTRSLYRKTKQTPFFLAEDLTQNRYRAEDTQLERSMDHDKMIPYLRDAKTASPK